MEKRLTRALLPVVLAAIVAATLPAPAHAGGSGQGATDIRHVPARRETVLAWDDGTPETGITGQTAMAVAVGFQAPPWATHVVGIEYYIMDDGQTNPEDPEAPTTAPFMAWVWRPSQDTHPGVPANDGYVPFGWYECPEDELVRVTLPDPIDITNDALFPDRQFFVGLEWMYRHNPIIGVDTDPPASGWSYRWNWSEWEQLDWNIIIRAVVWARDAAIIYVDASGGGDYLTIQEGIDAASEGDTVLVAPGTYTGPLNRGLGFEGKNVALVSEAGAASTIIDCEQQDRGFYFVSGEGGDAFVRGFTVRNGSGSGGGVRCVNSWPTIVDCVFSGNDGGSYGGGMYCNNAVSPSPTLSGCTFADNHAADCGGAILLDFSEPLLENCTLHGNSAPAGGGISCGTYSFPTITNCIIALSTEGEAVHCAASSNPVINHCCIYANAGGDSLCGYHWDNLFADPLFCDPGQGDLTLHSDSPCLPANNPWGELIGAWGQGCGESPVESPTTWGQIKAMYR